jgi:hypothetical protein
MKLTKAILALMTFVAMFVSEVVAQPLNKKITFTHADTLRGSYGPWKRLVGCIKI